jgi:catechol 2,3-dioxygenase-like lactoylglutathione lyase family enzyme
VFASDARARYKRSWSSSFETAAEGEWMITLDHVGFAVADYQRSKAFYEKALAPLGLKLLMEFSGAAAGFGRTDGERPSLFVEAHGEPVRGRLHIALRAESRAQVDAFHAAAIEAGGTDNGAPACGGTTPTTTAATSSIPTVTTSRLSATSPARTVRWASVQE